MNAGLSAGSLLFGLIYGQWGPEMMYLATVVWAGLNGLALTFLYIFWAPMRERSEARATDAAEVAELSGEEGASITRNSNTGAQNRGGTTGAAAKDNLLNEDGSDTASNIELDKMNTHLG